MSIEFDQRQLQAKQKAQADTAKKAASLRGKEAEKRGAAAKARESATRTRSESTARMKAGEARRAEDAANRYGKDASALEAKASAYGTDAAKLQAKIAKAEAVESAREARKRDIALRAANRAMRAAQEEQRRIAEQAAAAYERVDGVEAKTDAVLRALRAPKAERLRILMLGASPEGDLRIAREHTRIRRAVEVSVHRDLVDIDPRLSATTQDLLEGIAKFRPHVVHFSGHGGEELVSFEDELDERHSGIVVTANAFASVCAATDDPPMVVVLNACQSASIADRLVQRFAPIAIGMHEDIDDGDALHYATALYSSIANGHSVGSAHLAGKAAVELAGGEHELPYLVAADGVDPSAVILVCGPDQ